MCHHPVAAQTQHTQEECWCRRGTDLSGQSNEDEDRPRLIHQWEQRAEHLEALKKQALDIKGAN